MAQGIQEQRWRLPAIEAEGHFIQVGCEMLCTDAVPRSDDAPLEQRKGRFHGVRVNVAVNIDVAFVPDRFMLLDIASPTHRVWIGGPFIGDHHVNIFADVFADVLCECCALSILGVEEPEITVALAKADNDFLFGSATANTSTTLATADIGFVHFDRTVHHGAFYFAHGCTNAMT